ncbi:MAG: hypothetical protein M3P98_04075 [bacterium]|nr:hypothetical protein [bacterium]
MNKRRYPQKPKNTSEIGNAFRMFRPLTLESAETLYDRIKEVKNGGDLPTDAVLFTPTDLHLTLIEKGKMRRNLKNLSIGFNAAVQIARIHQDIDHAEQDIQVSLGHGKPMGRHNVAVGIEQSIEIGDEYAIIINALREARVPYKETFRPHISLFKLPSSTNQERQFYARSIGVVLPEHVMLAGIDSNHDK